jgi:hypothetical protein
MGIRITNDELRTVRDAMRDLNRMIESLEAGEVEKFVLAKQHQMRAVVISLEDYVALQEAAAPSEQRAAA